MQKEYTVTFTALRIGSSIDGKCSGKAAKLSIVDFMRPTRKVL